MKTRHLIAILPAALLLTAALHSLWRPGSAHGVPAAEPVISFPAAEDKESPGGAAAAPLSSGERHESLGRVEKRVVPGSLRATEPDYRYGQELPLRAARLIGWRPEILDELRTGMTVALPQMDGSMVHGIIHTAVNPREGLRTVAGNLTHPRTGYFHMERSEAGLRASFAARGAETVSMVFPAVDGGYLLVEERRSRTVCVTSPRDSAAGLNDLNGGVFEGGAPSLEVSAGSEWNLQSFPGATGVVYLDFNGQTVTNTKFNTESNNGQPIVAAAHPDFTPGNAKYRPDWIVRIWEKCREDFAPFNLNITTNEAVFNNANAARRVRVLITSTQDWHSDTEGKLGGVAYVGSFHWGSDTPCWVWNPGIDYSIPETISHEVGHALGLSHSSRKVSAYTYVEYYSGHGPWSPIMGDSFNDHRTFTLWDNGELSGMLNHEDQVAIIAATGPDTNNCGFRADDHAGTFAGATALTANALGVIHTSGRIEQNGDKDLFRFTMPPGEFDLVVTPHSPGPNALVKVTLKNQQGNAVASGTACEGTDHSGTSVQLKYTGAAASIYYLEVTNAGHASHQGDPGFSSYATLGNYQVEITEPGGDDQHPVIYFYVGPVVPGYDSILFCARITDNRGVDLNTAGAGVCKIQKGGQTWNAVLDHTEVSDTKGLKLVDAYYRLTAPGGYWDPADAGNYTVSYDGTLVKDLTGLTGNQATDTFTAPVNDGGAPSVSLVPGAEPPVEGTEHYEFTVMFTDADSAFQIGSFGADDMLVTDADLTPLTVTLKEVTGSEYNRKVFATWSVAAPGGTWSAENIGIYSIALKAGGIVSGATPVAGKVLGTFQHQTALFSRNMDVNPGFTLNAGWAFGTPTGQGGNGSIGQDPSSGADGPSVLGTNLAGNYELGVAAVRYATSPFFSTLGFQDLTLTYDRWLNTTDQVTVEYRVGAGPWKVLWDTDFDYEWKWETASHELPAECAHQAQVQLRWGIGPTANSGARGGWNLDNIRVLAASPFAPGRITLTPVGRFTVYEDGRAPSSYKLKLDQDPGANPVTITLTPSKAGELVLPATVVLDSTNWSTGKTVIVTAVNDSIFKGIHGVSVAHTAVSADPRFNGLVGPILSALVYDDDAAVIATQPANKTAPAGTPVSLTVVPAFPADLHTYQWYSGTSGQTGRPWNNGTTAALTLPTPSAPSSLWVRVTRHLTGGGTIVQDSSTAVVAPLTGYPAWKYALLSHGYTQAQLDAPAFDAGDPEGDGLTHWTEYAFGGQPWLRDTDLLPRMEQTPEGTLLRFRRVRADVNYTIQISEDAVLWSEFVTNPGSVSAVTDQAVLLPAEGKGRLFARIRLSPQ